MQIGTKLFKEGDIRHIKRMDAGESTIKGSNVEETRFNEDFLQSYINQYSGNNSSTKKNSL